MLRYIQNLDKRNGGLYTARRKGRDEVDKRWQAARFARVFLPPVKEPRLPYLGSVLRLDRSYVVDTSNVTKLKLGSAVNRLVVGDCVS